MKKLIFTILFVSSILSACSKNTENPVQSSAQSARENTISSQTAENAWESVIDKPGNENAEIDLSVDFDSYDNFIDSEKLREYLKNRGLNENQISDPIYDKDKFSIDNITLYESCSYFSFTELSTKKSITVCLAFTHYDSFDSMAEFFDANLNDPTAYNSAENWGADKEKQVYAIKNERISLYRLTGKGLLYSIFSDDLSDDELYGYIEKIKF